MFFFFWTIQEYLPEKKTCRKHVEDWKFQVVFLWAFSHVACVSLASSCGQIGLAQLSDLWSPLSFAAPSGGHTHPRRGLHEPKASAALHQEVLPRGCRPRRAQASREGSNNEGTFRVPSPAPLRPHRGLPGRARCTFHWLEISTVNGLFLSSLTGIMSSVGMNPCGYESCLPTFFSISFLFPCRADKPSSVSINLMPSTIPWEPASYVTCTWRQKTTSMENILPPLLKSASTWKWPWNSHEFSPQAETTDCLRCF